MATQTGTPITVFASSARTGGGTGIVTSDVVRSGLATGEGHTKGLALVIDCTAISATPSVVFTLEVATGNAAFAVIATSSAVTTNDTTTSLIIHPDVANDRANVADQGPMRTKWQLVATHADMDSITYSVIAFPLT